MEWNIDALEFMLIQTELTLGLNWSGQTWVLEFHYWPGVSAPEHLVVLPPGPSFSFRGSRWAISCWPQRFVGSSSKRISSSSSLVFLMTSMAVYYWSCCLNAGKCTGQLRVISPMNSKGVRGPGGRLGSGVRQDVLSVLEAAWMGNHRQRVIAPSCSLAAATDGKGELGWCMTVDR